MSNTVHKAIQDILYHSPIAEPRYKHLSTLNSFKSSVRVCEICGLVTNKRKGTRKNKANKFLLAQFIQGLG